VEKRKSKKTDVLRNIGKQSEESVKSVLKVQVTRGTEGTGWSRKGPLSYQSLHHVSQSLGVVPKRTKHNKKIKHKDINTSKCLTETQQKET